MQYFVCGMLLVLSSCSVVMALTWQDVASELMSPACPGRTLVNCVSSQAEQWRELIRQQLAQGATKDQVIQSFVAIRGEEILAAPPKHGFALTAWLLPVIVVVNGIGLIVLLTVRWARKSGTGQGACMSTHEAVRYATLSDPHRQRLHRELEEFHT